MKKMVLLLQLLFINIIIDSTLFAVPVEDDIEQGWTEIPKKKTIEEEWEFLEKEQRPDVSNAAYTQLGVSKNASPFEILGIKVTTNKNDSKKAYQNLIKKWHPDKNRNKLIATEVTQLLHWAYGQIK